MENNDLPIASRAGESNGYQNDSPPVHQDAADLLSDRQHYAIDLLVTGVPRVLVAKAIGIARSTLYNWLGSPVFEAELGRRRALVREDLADEIVALYRLTTRAAADAVEAGDQKTVLGLLRLLDVDTAVSPMLPMSLASQISHRSNVEMADAERALRGELTMRSLRSLRSVMDEVGEGRRAVHAAAVDAIRRQAEIDFRAELEASAAAGWADGSTPPVEAAGREHLREAAADDMHEASTGDDPSDTEVFETGHLFLLDGMSSPTVASRRNR